MYHEHKSHTLRAEHNNISILFIIFIVDETVSYISIKRLAGCIIRIIKNLIVFVALGAAVVFGGL